MAYGLPFSEIRSKNAALAQLQGLKGDIPQGGVAYAAPSLTPAQIARANAMRTVTDGNLLKKYVTDISGDGKVTTKDYLVWAAILLLAVGVGYLVFKNA